MQIPDKIALEIADLLSLLADYVRADPNGTESIARHAEIHANTLRNQR